MFKYLLTFLAFTVVLASCKKDEAEIVPVEKKLSNTVEFTSVLRFAITGPVYNSSPLEKLNVFSDEIAWTAFKSEMNNSVLNNVTVDFDTEMLVVLVDWQYAQYGSTINIVNAVESRNQIFISTLTSFSLPPDVAVIALAANPGHVYKIPKTTKPIVLL